MSPEVAAIFAFSCVVSLLLSYGITKDPFSPAVLGALFFAGSVGGSAFTLRDVDIQQIYRYNFDAHVMYYIVGMVLFVAGALSIRPAAQVVPAAIPLSPLNARQVRTITRVALALGALSWLIYVLQIRAGGGFVEVYSNVKGRGDLGSGLQDLLYLAVPATSLMMIVFNRTNNKLKAAALVLICILPLLVTGILSSRRGPSVQALSTLFFSYYMTTQSRPSLIVLISAICSGIFLALFLVAFRGDIYLGSDLLATLSLEKAVGRIDEFASRPMEGHEFIYSSFVMVHSSYQNDFWYGARYLAALTLWWIPSFIFPGKYEAFGLEAMLVNGGTNGTNTIEALYSPGAAPMFLADLYVEFWYFGLLFSFLLGRFLAALWTRACRDPALSTVIYLCALSVMVYLFAQNFTAFAQRFAIMALTTLIVAKWFGLRSVPAGSVGAPPRFRYNPPVVPADNCKRASKLNSLNKRQD